MRPKRRAWVTAPLAALALLSMAACNNGSALVTLTATASTDTFITYRVSLLSVALQDSGGKTKAQALPVGTAVDLVNLLNVSEVLGVATAPKANYKAVIVTLDYSAAEIVYDDGSLNGVPLAPVGTGGRTLGEVALTLNLDPSATYSVTSNSLSRLALDFKLAASNIVDTSRRTVTVTPLIGASAAPIDGKAVRIRGPLESVANTNSTFGSFATGITPFDFAVPAAGQMEISTSEVTTYLVNGLAATGPVGLTQLAGMATGAMTVALGTLTSAANGTATTANSATQAPNTNVYFSAAEVLSGTNVQSPTQDRVSGTVSATNGAVMTIQDGTLLGFDGSNTFLPGITVVLVGAGTLVAIPGQGVPELLSIAQISVGSVVSALGTATTSGSGGVTLDATAGQVEIGLTMASGLVTLRGTNSLNLRLTSLGGRSVGALDLAGVGAIASNYTVATGPLDLANSTVGVPVEVWGFVTALGTGAPDFSAVALLDPTTIPAELVVDYGTGTAAPFTTYDSSAIGVDALNASIGSRHEIQVGAQTIDVIGLTSNPTIAPDTAASTLLFLIGHTVSGTVENFDTFAAFITQLHAELTGSALVTGITALGQYTPSTYSFSATSMTVTLGN